jgi:hypothetical protein
MKSMLLHYDDDDKYWNLEKVRMAVIIQGKKKVSQETFIYNFIMEFWSALENRKLDDAITEVLKSIDIKPEVMDRLRSEVKRAVLLRLKDKP